MGCPRVGMSFHLCSTWFYVIIGTRRVNDALAGAPWRWLRTARETKREDMRVARRTPQPFDRDHLARNDKQGSLSFPISEKESLNRSLLNSISRNEHYFHRFRIRIFTFHELNFE